MMADSGYLGEDIGWERRYQKLIGDLSYCPPCGRWIRKIRETQGSKADGM